MGWNLQAHITGHSFFTSNGLADSFQGIQSQTDNLKHFNVSFLDIDFIQQGIIEKESQGAKLKLVLDELLVMETVKVKNGWDTLADGSKVQKFTNRKIDLSKTLSAVHIEDPTGQTTHPHIHILHDKNQDFGKGYQWLKEAIRQAADKHGLVPNFDEPTEFDQVNMKAEAKKAKQFSWLLQESRPGLQEKISDVSFIQDQLSNLHTYAKASGNIEFYAKVISKLEEKIDKYNLLEIYQDIDLNKPLFDLLSNPDKSILEKLQTGEINKSDIELNNKIWRDYIRYSVGTRAAVFARFEKMGYAFPKINNVQAVIGNIKREKKQRTFIREEDRESINQIFIRDLKHVLAHARNEKELKTCFQELGYQDFSIATKIYQGEKKRIGFIFSHPEKDVSIKLANIGIHWNEITYQLMQNAKNNQINPFTTYASSMHEYHFKALPSSKEKRRYYAIYKTNTSENLKIWTMPHQNILWNGRMRIIDDKEHGIIRVEKADDIHTAAREAIKLALAKGWKLEEIEFSGSREFCQEIQTILAEMQHGQQSSRHIDTASDFKEEVKQSFHNRPISAKQRELLEKLAKAHGFEFDEDIRSNRAKELISEWISKPTLKQIQYARYLASKLKQSLPENVISDKKSVRSFIEKSKELLNKAKKMNVNVEYVKELDEAFSSSKVINLKDSIKRLRSSALDIDTSKPLQGEFFSAMAMAIKSRDINALNTLHAIYPIHAATKLESYYLALNIQPGIVRERLARKYGLDIEMARISNSVLELNLGERFELEYKQVRNELISETFLIEYVSQEEYSEELYQVSDSLHDEIQSFNSALENDFIQNKHFEQVIEHFENHEFNSAQKLMDQSDFSDLQRHELEQIREYYIDHAAQYGLEELSEHINRDMELEDAVYRLGELRDERDVIDERLEVLRGLGDKRKSDHSHQWRNIQYPKLKKEYDELKLQRSKLDLEEKENPEYQKQQQAQQEKIRQERQQRPRAYRYQ